MLGVSVVLLFVFTVFQARRGAVAAKSPERKAAECRQAVGLIEAEIRKALTETFADVPRIPIRTKDRPNSSGQPTRSQTRRAGIWAGSAGGW